MTFKLGDIVRRRRGTQPAKIVDVYYNSVTCEYLHSRYTFNTPITNLVHFKNEEQTVDREQLYSFKRADNSIGYGIHAGTNSKGQYLIEEKGTGIILALLPTEVEEVLPFTFSVTYNNNGAIHYLGVPGAVAVGDFVIETTKPGYPIGQVTAVNTKNRETTIKFRGFKVPVEKIQELE